MLINGIKSPILPHGIITLGSRHIAAIKHYKKLRKRRFGSVCCFTMDSLVPYPVNNLEDYTHRMNIVYEVYRTIKYDVIENKLHIFFYKNEYFLPYHTIGIGFTDKALKRKT